MNLARNVTQLARKFTPTTNRLRSAPSSPIQPAAWLPSLVARNSTVNTMAETIQNGNVSLSRFGLPLLSNAQRDST
jgi:hypothetical protein